MVSSMKLCGVQFGFRPQISKTKLRRISVPLRGVMDFGMELHCVILLRGILDGGDGVRGLGDQLEAGREFIGFVAVRHPDRQRPFEALEQRGRRGQQFDLRVAVLALVGRANFAAQLVHHELQAVADAQYGQAEMQHAIVGRRRVGVVDRRRPARQDDARGRDSS